VRDSILRLDNGKYPSGRPRDYFLEGVFCQDKEGESLFER